VLEDFPSPYHTLTEGGHTPGEGADFLLGEVTDTVTRVRTEQGLLTYLSCLKALGGAPYLRSLKAITRLRLQSELYSLTSPGGGRAGALCTLALLHSLNSLVALRWMGTYMMQDINTASRSLSAAQPCCQCQITRTRHRSGVCSSNNAGDHAWQL